MKLEQAILKNLVYNEEYLRKVLPFLKLEYFSDSVERTLFNEITSFTETYNNTATIEALSIAIKEKRNLSSDEVQRCEEYLSEIEKNKSAETEVQWLVDKTEKFCQEKAIYNAVLGSISILDGKDKNHESQKVVYQLRRLTLLWRGLVLVNLFLCVMWLLRAWFRVKMFFTSLWK